MPLMLEDLKPNKLYNKKVILPINDDNKRKGSLIYVLSPNIEETIKVISSEGYHYLRNPNLFTSYYMEKDINLIINEGVSVTDVDRELVFVEVGLSKYYRYTTMDSEEMKKLCGKDLNFSETGVVFKDINDEVVAWLLLSGNTLVDAWSMGANLDRDIMEFAVEVLKVNCIHKKLDKKFHKYLKDYNFKFVDGTGILMSTFKESALLEGKWSGPIAVEIAIYQAQAKIIEDIINNYDNENWMRVNYNSFKNKITKIPLPDFSRKIDDSLESIKIELANHKATIVFLTDMAALEAKESFEIEDMAALYLSYLKKVNIPKNTRLKLIRKVKNTYKTNIALYETNLKRYERQSESEKRMENVVAIATKAFSAFSFFTSGPLGFLKGMAFKAIMPKSNKVNVMSEAELRSKIELYERLVTELEELEAEVVSEGVLTESDLNNKPMYFYHVAPRSLKGRGDLYSLQYLYDHKIYDLFDKYTDKYRNRIVYDWGYHKNKKPEQLTREEILSALKKFRKTSNLNQIYFFRYPPTPDMGNHMANILGDKKIYAIDINNPEVKKYIDYIDWGFEGSNSNNKKLSRRYYEEISIDDYFDNYDDSAVMNYASLNHISISFKNGYCPGYLLTPIDECIDESASLLETPLTTKQRKNLKDSDYGLPAKKKFPMPDKAHVKAAVRMYNRFDGPAEDKRTLAFNILDKIKEFDMEDEIVIGKDNGIYQYCPASMKEDVILKPLWNKDRVITESASIRSHESITFFESTLTEDSTFDKGLRRILFSERIRNHKEVLAYYDAIKSSCINITKTYVDLKRYNGQNLFIGCEYYIENFLKNNYFKLDKSVNISYEFINRLIDDKRFREFGYNKKTIFIPVYGWGVDKDSDFWDYRVNVNPMSIIHRLVVTGQTYRLKKWSDVEFVFLGKTGYFKVKPGDLEKKNLPKFRNNLTTLLKNGYVDCSDEADDSTKGMVVDIISRIEDPAGLDNDTFSSHIQIDNITGDSKTVDLDTIGNKKAKAIIVSSDDELTDTEKKAERDKKAKELLSKVEKAASTAASTTDAIKKLEEDEDFAQIVNDLKMISPNTVQYSATRISRMNVVKDNFHSRTYQNKKLGDIVVGDKYDDTPLREKSLPIDSTNEEWKHLKGSTFADDYDVNDDILRVIYHFSNCKVPVGVIDYTIENTSTSEDSVNTWTLKCEDINGKRFTLKFDVPIIINKRFMKLRGNEKVMNNQLMNLPIIKTGLNTTQITSNYNKIFLSPYGSSSGKSFVTADRLMKTLKKYTGKNITITNGNNTKICNRYELPLDYIDIAGTYTSIKAKNSRQTVEYFFNQDVFREKYKDMIKDKDRLPIGVLTITGNEATIIYADGEIPISSQISFMICSMDNEFRDIYDHTTVSNKYTFTMASIMSSEIPAAVIIGYAIGLIPMLDRAGIKYQVLDKKAHYDKSVEDVLRLKDAVILYELDYTSSMLLNGLKSCDLSSYSIKEVNSPAMWLDFLDLYGGRLKSDGLDMFYDLMFDPITKIVCRKYDIPDNYVDSVLYANMLLSDNKYNKHVDLRGNRYRNNEIIAAYVYKALCNSYSTYRRNLKVGRDMPMSIKQSAVIDLIMQDNTESDYSTMSPLLEFESANATSFKGLSGMNSDRAYGLDKRNYDETMVNILSVSTGFAGNVGIVRQTTIDPNIDSQRGYIKGNPDKLSITQSLCMTEALTPYGLNSDDAFRTAMTYVQTAKHGMRTSIGDPLLVTNGADEALVYLTSDTFSHKAKGRGKVKEKTDDYMVIEYNQPEIKMSDGSYSKYEVIDLRERMMKNSDGGFYQALKLDSDYKVGDIVRENDIIAIDKLSYNTCVGPKDNYAYNIGTLVKFAVVNSDEGYEDSCRSTHWLAKALSSTVVVEQQYSFDKDTNIYHIVKPGQQIQEGEPIIIFQNAFEDEDANALIRALKSDDNADVVEELGRIVLKSKVTGVIKDVQVRRCVETNECSSTIQKIIKEYERRVSSINKAYDKYDKDKAKIADPTYKLPPIGKLKNCEDQVMITIYLAYQDDFGVSDKVVCYSALKGVSSKEIIPEGKEAYSAFRPDERIHYIQSEIGDFKRMVGSIFKIGALNKVLIELHRRMCEDCGIKWKYLDED